MPGACWKEVLWTDKVSIELFGHSVCFGHNEVCLERKKRAEFHDKNTYPTIKYRGGPSMLWVSVAASGAGNMSLVVVRMDSNKYLQILAANITPSVKKKKKLKLQ